MPILMNVENLEPGMCLAANVTNNLTVLLPHGRKLTDSDISALRKKFPYLSVQVVDPLLDEAVEFDDNRHDAEVSMEVRRNITKVTNKVSNQVRAGVAIDSSQVEGMERVVEEMLDYLQSNPVTIAIVEQTGGWDSYIQEHSANVFYLSMLMGNTIRNYVKQERERQSAAKTIHNAMNITPLGTAAMFHDLGMAPIAQVYHKEEALTESEKQSILKHPITGSEMLPTAVDPMVRLIIRQHHENQDGSGYPNQLLGDKINVFSRILRIADAYSAAIAERVYYRSKTPAQALFEMVHGPFRQCYDPILLKVFSGIVQPLPIGAKLALNTGETAVVVKHNRKDGFNPIIIVAFDELGDPVPKEELQPPFELRSRADIKVTQFADSDITFFNEISTDATPQPVPPSEEVDIEPIQREMAEVFDYAYP